MTIQFYDASTIDNPEAVWAFHVLVTARQWGADLARHAVDAAEDVVPQGVEHRRVRLLHAASRIGGAVLAIEHTKAQAETCPTNP